MKKMSEKGELQKYAKSVNAIEREYPKIIRTEDKIDASIEERSNAEYKILYVPLSKIDEAKKEWDSIWDWYHTNYAQLTYPSNENILQTKFEKFGKKWFGDSAVKGI